MRNHLVYDLPTRLFHWLFAGLFVFAFVVAKTIDSESLTYSFHMLAGLTLSFIAILRAIWGVIGTKHARFSGFALNPQDLWAYFAGLFSGDRRRWVGHNPASSWTALVMMILTLGLGFSGYMMASTGSEEAFEDIHEIFANAFLVVVILHVFGVIFHTVRHRDMIGLSMVDGRKDSVPPGGAIPNARRGSGLIFIMLVAMFAIFLARGFDTHTRVLEVFGMTLQLGDSNSASETP